MSTFRTGVQILNQVKNNKGRGLLRVRSVSAGRRLASASHSPGELLDATTKSSGTEQPQILQPKRSRSWFSVFRQEEPPPPLKAVPQTKDSSHNDDTPWLSFFKKKEVPQDTLDQQPKEEKERDSFIMEHQALVCQPDVVKIMQQDLGSSEVVEQSGRQNQIPPSTTVENRLLELQAQRLHPFQARISNITEYLSNVRRIKSKAIESKAQKLHMKVDYSKFAQPQYLQAFIHGAQYPKIQSNYKYKNLNRSFNQTSNLSFTHSQELSEEITRTRLNKSKTLSEYENNRAQEAEYTIHQSAAHLKVPYEILAGSQACQPNNADVKRFCETDSAIKDTQPHIHIPENVDSYKPYKKYLDTQLNVNNSKNTEVNIVSKDSCENPNGNSFCSAKEKNENFQRTETQSKDSVKAGSERDIGEHTRFGQKTVKSTRSVGQIFHVEKRMYSKKVFERRSFTNENIREYSKLACESEYPLSAKLNETKDKRKDAVKNICQEYINKPEIKPSYSEILKTQLQKTKILKKMEANSCNESCPCTLSEFPESELTASCNTDKKAGGGWYTYGTTCDKTLQSEEVDPVNQESSGKQALLYGKENNEQACNKSLSALSDLDISKETPNPAPTSEDTTGSKSQPEKHSKYIKDSSTSFCNRTSYIHENSLKSSSLQDSIFSENMKRTRKNKEETIMTIQAKEWVPLIENKARIKNSKTNTSNSSEAFSKLQISNCEELEDIKTARNLKLLPSCKPAPSCNTKESPQRIEAICLNKKLKKPLPESVCETNKRLAAMFCSSKPTPSWFKTSKLCKENTPHLSQVTGDPLLVAQKNTSERTMDKQLNHLFKSDKKAKEKGLSNPNNSFTLENKGKKLNFQNDSTDISPCRSKQVLSSSENIPCLSKYSLMKDAKVTGSLGAIRGDFITSKEQQMNKDNNEQYSMELKTNSYVNEEVPASMGEINLLPDPLGNKEEPFPSDAVGEVKKRNEWVADSSIHNLTVHPIQNRYIVKEPQIQKFKQCIPIKVIQGSMSKNFGGRLRKHSFTSKMAYSTLSSTKTPIVNNYTSPKQYNPNLRVGHGSMCYSVRYQSKKSGGKEDEKDKKCKKMPFGEHAARMEGECTKLVAPGCNKPKQIVCEKEVKLSTCTRIAPPMPSYSECLKEKTPPPRFTECKPIPAKTCEIKEKKTSYDGCNPPGKRKRSLCPDSRPEAKRETSDKTCENPPCEGPKPDECNRKCAGIPSSPVRCYSSLCPMMRINQRYSQFETGLYSDIKPNNVAICKPVQCQERVYSQSSDSKGKKEKDKCTKVPFGEHPRKGERDCTKLVAPGCNKPRQIVCEKEVKLSTCTRIAPPMPSYSECLKEKTPPPRFTECKPIPAKTCEVKEKKTSYDGCNPPGKRKRSLCPDSRPEAKRETSDKTCENPPCEGPKPDECNRKCAGIPSSPVRCYSSLCCLVGNKRENSDFLSPLCTDLKTHNVTVSTAVQCQPKEYSLSSDSGKSKEEKEKCKEMLFGEVKHTTSEGQCMKLVASGCNRPTQTTCEMKMEVPKCTRVPPPWPAYSECFNDQSLAAKFSECIPKGPRTCDVEKKKNSYDGCNSSDTHQKSVCPAKIPSKTEPNKGVANKSNVNPPCEGPKQEDCNKKCAGIPTSPVQCYSSLCCLMGIKRENSNFLSPLHTDLKMTNVTVSRAVQCQRREYSQSSDSGKIPCISIKKSGASDKEGQRRKEDDIKRKSPGPNKVGSSSVPVRCYSDSFLRSSVPCKINILSQNYPDVKNSQLPIVSSFPYQSDDPTKGHEIGKTGGTKCKKYSFTHELAMKSKNESLKFAAYISNNAETAPCRSELKLCEIIPSSYSKGKDYSKGENHMEFNDQSLAAKFSVCNPKGPRTCDVGKKKNSYDGCNSSDTHQKSVSPPKIPSKPIENRNPLDATTQTNFCQYNEADLCKKIDHCNEFEGPIKYGYEEKELEYCEKSPKPSVPVGNTLDQLLTTVFPREKHIVSQNYSNINFKHCSLSKPSKSYVNTLTESYVDREIKEQILSPVQVVGKGGRERSSPTLCKIQTKECEKSSRKPHVPQYCENTKCKFANYRSSDGHLKEETECYEVGRNISHDMYFTHTESPKREISHHECSTRENRNSYEHTFEQDSLPHESFTSSLPSCSSPSCLVEQKHEQFYFPTHMYFGKKISDSFQKSNMHGSQGSENKKEGSRKNAHGKNTSQKSKSGCLRMVPSGNSRLKYIPFYLSKNETKGINKCTHAHLHSERMKEQPSKLGSIRNSHNKEFDCDDMKQNLREESSKLSEVEVLERVNLQSLFEGHKMAGFLQAIASSNSMEHSGFSLTNYFTQSFYFPKPYFSTVPIISLASSASLRSLKELSRSLDYTKNKLLCQELASLLFRRGPTALTNNVIKRHYSEDKKKDASNKEKCDELPPCGESRVSCNRVRTGDAGGKCEVKRSVLSFIKECARPRKIKGFQCEVKKKVIKKPIIKEEPKKTNIIECKKPITKVLKCPDKEAKEEVCEVKPKIIVKPFIECKKPPSKKAIDSCASWPKKEKVFPTGRCRMVPVQPFVQCPKPESKSTIRKCVDDRKSRNVPRICHETLKSKCKLCYIPKPDEKECEVPSKTSSENNSKSGSEAPKQSRSVSTDSRVRLHADYMGISKREKLGFVCKKTTLSSCRPPQSLKWTKYSKVVSPPKAFLECGKSVVGRQRAYKCTLKLAPKYLKHSLPYLEPSRYKSKPTSNATKCTKKQDNKEKQLQCPKVTDGLCEKNRSVPKNCEGTSQSPSFIDCLKSMLSFFKAREGCPEPGDWKKNKSKGSITSVEHDEESTVQNVIKDAARGKAKELERLLADDSQYKRLQQPGCKPPAEVVYKPNVWKVPDCRKVSAQKPSFSECERELCCKSKFNECNFESMKEAEFKKKSNQKNQLECEPEEKIEELKGCVSQLEPEPKSQCPFIKSNKKEDKNINEHECASQVCKMSEESEHSETLHRTSEAQPVQNICEELEDAPVKEVCATAKHISKVKKIAEVEELIKEELQEISKKGDTSSKVKEIVSKCKTECKTEVLDGCDTLPHKSPIKARAVTKKDNRKPTEVCETIGIRKQQRGNKQKSPKKDNRKLSRCMPKEEPKDCKSPYLSSDYILKRRISTSTLPAELDLVSNKYQLNRFRSKSVESLLKDNQSSSGLACCDKGSRVSSGKSDSLGPYLDLSTYYSNSLKFHMPIELSREGSSECKPVGGEFSVYMNNKTSGFENPSLYQILSYSAVASLVSNNRVIFKPLYQAGKMHKAEFHHGTLPQFCKKKAAHSEVIHKRSIFGSGSEKAIKANVKSELECKKVPFKCPNDKPRRVKVKTEERIIDFPKHPCKGMTEDPSLPSNTDECEQNKNNHVKQEDTICPSKTQLDMKETLVSTSKEDSKEAEDEFPKHPCKAPEADCQEDDNKITEIDNNKQCKSENQESTKEKPQNLSTCIKIPFKCPEEDSKPMETKIKSKIETSTCQKDPPEFPKHACKAVMEDKEEASARQDSICKDKESRHLEDVDRKSNSNYGDEDKSCKKVNRASDDEAKGIAKIEIVAEFPKHPCKLAEELCAQPRIAEDIKMKPMGTSDSDCDKRKNPKPEHQNQVSDECKLKDTDEESKFDREVTRLESNGPSICKKIPFKCGIEDANEVKKEKKVVALPDHLNYSSEISELSLLSSEDKGKVQLPSVCTGGIYRETHQKKEPKFKSQITSACQKDPPELLNDEDEIVAQTEIKTDIKAMAEFPCKAAEEVVKNIKTKAEFPCKAAEEVVKNATKSDYEGDLKLKSVSIKKIIPTSCINEDSSKIEKEIKINYETAVELPGKKITEGDKDRRKETDDSFYPKPEFNFQNTGSKEESKSDLKQSSEAASKKYLKHSASLMDLKLLAESAYNKFSLKYLVQNAKLSKLGKMKRETRVDASEHVQKFPSATDPVIGSHLKFCLHNGDMKIDSHGNKEQRDNSLGKLIGEQHNSEEKAKAENPTNDVHGNKEQMDNSLGKLIGEQHNSEEKAKAENPTNDVHGNEEQRDNSLGKLIGEQHNSEEKAKAENPTNDVASKCSQACTTEIEKNKCDTQTYSSPIREKRLKAIPIKSCTKQKGKAKISIRRNIEKTIIKCPKKGDFIKIDKSAQKVTSSSSGKIYGIKRKLSVCKPNQETSKSKSDAPSINIRKDPSNEVSLKDKIYCNKKCPPSSKVNKVLQQEDKTNATCHLDNKGDKDERKTNCALSSKADSAGKKYASPLDDSIQKRLSNERKTNCVMSSKADSAGRKYSSPLDDSIQKRLSSERKTNCVMSSKADSAGRKYSSPLDDSIQKRLSSERKTNCVMSSKADSAGKKYASPLDDSLQKQLNKRKADISVPFFRCKEGHEDFIITKSQTNIACGENQSNTSHSPYKNIQAQIPFYKQHKNNNNKKNEKNVMLCLMSSKIRNEKDVRADKEREVKLTPCFRCKQGNGGTHTTTVQLNHHYNGKLSGRSGEQTQTEWREPKPPEARKDGGLKTTTEEQPLKKNSC